jgi:hypothetical protein
MPSIPEQADDVGQVQNLRAHLAHLLAYIRDHQPEEGGGEEAGQAEGRAHDDHVHEAPRSIWLPFFAVGSRHLESRVG